MNLKALTSVSGPVLGELMGKCRLLLPLLIFNGSTLLPFLLRGSAFIGGERSGVLYGAVFCDMVALAVKFAPLCCENPFVKCSCLLFSGESANVIL